MTIRRRTSIPRDSGRRPIVALIVALLLAVLGSSLPAAAGVAAVGRHAVVVDPGLATALATGPQRLVLSWDDAAATRAEVLAYLDRSGVDHYAFSHLDMAVVCAGSERDLSAVTGTPGAISIFGDEELTPALDGPVPATDSSGAPVAPASIDTDMTGDGVGIVVLDTGVDATHPDLELGGKTVLNTAVVVSHYEILGVGEDTCAPDTYAEDLDSSEVDSGHGTALAGVAAGDGTASSGQYAGVAPGADVVGVNVAFQVTPDHHGDAKMSLIRFIASVNYVLSNTLIGGPTVAKVAIIGWARDGLYDPFHPHFLAVRDLWDFGIVPVVPVGNGDGSTSDCSRPETCEMNAMGVGSHVIAVGAATDEGTGLADFSAVGDPNPQNARGQWVSYEPTLVTPGTNVVAPFRPGLSLVGTPEGSTIYPSQGAFGGSPMTDPRYQPYTGTSIAAARVAGAIALMQQKAVETSGCFLPSFMVKHLLTKTATTMDGFARHEVGAGLLDIEKAVAFAGDREEAIYGGPNPWDCAR